MKDTDLLKATIELLIINGCDPKAFEESLKKMEGYYEADSK